MSEEWFFYLLLFTLLAISYFICKGYKKEMDAGCKALKISVFGEKRRF